MLGDIMQVWVNGGRAPRIFDLRIDSRDCSMFLLNLEDMWLTQLYSRPEQVLRHSTDWAVLRDSIFSVWIKLTWRPLQNTEQEKNTSGSSKFNTDTPRSMR